MKQLEKERQEEAQCTFKPKIRSRSVGRRRQSGAADLLPAKSKPDNVFDRLAQAKAEKDATHRQLEEEAAQRERQECTFQPNIGRRRSRGRSPGPAGRRNSPNEKLPVWERLNHDAEEAHRRL